MATRAKTQDQRAPLHGQTAVVAGATRGAGRGIARALAEAGATVYCTGRSTRGHPSAYNRPETIDETADMIAAAGGTAIAARVDHTVEADVKALFARVEREQGRLDVLVNSIAGEDPLLGGWGSLEQTDLANVDAALRQSLVSHVITAKHGAALMKKNSPLVASGFSRKSGARELPPEGGSHKVAPVAAPRRSGLIVEVTEHDLLFGGGGNVISGIVKSALKGLAVTLSEELRKHRIAVVSITPGFLRSESMLQHFGVTEANWRDGGKKDPHFLQSESPLFVGRAVAALAADPKVLARSSQILSSWDLAREYGFTDADGRTPDWGTYGRESVIPSMKWMRDSLERHVEWLEALAARGRAYLGATQVGTSA